MAEPENPATLTFLDLALFAPERLEIAARALEAMAAAGRRAGASEAAASALEAFARTFRGAAEGRTPIRAVGLALADVPLSELVALLAELDGAASDSAEIGDDDGASLLGLVRIPLEDELARRVPAGGVN